MNYRWIFKIIIGGLFSAYGLSGDKTQGNPRVLEEGNRLLFKSARAGDTKGIQEAVLSYAYIKIKDSAGRTALHYAVESGDYLCTAFLLGLGLKPDLADDQGETPLMIAAHLGKIACVKILLDARADVSLSNKRGDRVIHYAVNRENNEALLQLLINRGAQLSHEDSDGRPVLHRAIWAGSVSMVRFLLEELGVQYNSIDREGNTACKLASDCTSGVGFAVKGKKEKVKAKAVEELFQEYSFFEIEVEKKKSKKISSRARVNLPKKEKVLKEVKSLLRATEVLKRKRIRQGLRKFQDCVMDFVAIIKHRKKVEESKKQRIVQLLFLRYKQEVKTPKNKKGFCSNCLIS